MKIIEKYKQQMDEEIKMMKKTPIISDRSKAIAKKSKERKTNQDELIVNRLMNDAARRQQRAEEYYADREKFTFNPKEIEVYEEEGDDIHNQTGD